jgi:hypothetical protein
MNLWKRLVMGGLAAGAIALTGGLVGCTVDAAVYDTSGPYYDNNLYGRTYYEPTYPVRYYYEPSGRVYYYDRDGHRHYRHDYDRRHYEHYEHHR